MSIDCQDVLAYDAVLYTQLINYPGEVIPLFDSEANLIASELSGHSADWTSMDITLKVRADRRSCLRRQAWLRNEMAQADLQS